MTDWVIDNTVVGTLWLAAAGLAAYRYRERSMEVDRTIRGESGIRTSSEEARKLRSTIVAEAFVTAGLLLLSYVILDWLF